MALYARGRNTGAAMFYRTLVAPDMRFSMTSSGRGAQRELITVVPQSQLDLMDLSKRN